MEFQEPYIFWFNKEHFTGTVYANAQPLTIFSEAEMTALIVDVLESNRESMEFRLFEPSDIPTELIAEANYTVFKVDKEGWMQLVGWMDDVPPDWRT